MKRSRQGRTRSLSGGKRSTFFMASVTSGASAVMARRAERQDQLNEKALAGVSGESEEYSESSMSHGGGGAAAVWQGGGGGARDCNCNVGGRGDGERARANARNAEQCSGRSYWYRSARVAAG